jgi:proton glutamate symport protein
MSPTGKALTGLTVGLVAGSAISLAADPRWLPVTRIAEAVGTLWVNAILMTVIPLIVSSLVVGVASAASPRMIGRVGGRAVAVFVILLVAAAVVSALALPAVMSWMPSDPAAAASLAPAGATPGEPVVPPSLAQWLVNLVPVNPVKAAADGALLPLIVFTLGFALAVAGLQPEQKQLILRLAEAVSAAMMRLLAWIVALAPVGVFALALALAAKAGPTIAGELGYYVLVAVSACAVTTLALYAVARVFAGIPIRRFARAVGPAQAVGFTSHSSLAALPTLVEDARKVLGLGPEITTFGLPLAAATFKYSAPVGSLAAAFFISRLYGIPIAPGAIPTVVIMAVLTSFSVPGVGGGAVFAAMGPVLLAAGLPAQALGLLFAVDPIPNAARTVANVTGYLAAATVMAGRPDPGTTGEQRST